MLELSKDVKYVKGVGPSRVKLLNKLNIFTLEDLITYFPREHEDRGNVKDIIELVDGEEALIDVVCVSRMSEARIRKNMTICKLVVRDETAMATITWFNMTYLKSYFKIGERYKFFGKVKRTPRGIEMISPVFDLENTEKNTGKIIPLYPLTYNLSQNVIRKIIENGLAEVKGSLEETLPNYLLEKYSLMDINQAIEQIHFPKDFENYNKAKKRLAFEEILIMQLALLNLKNKYNVNLEGISFSKDVKMSEIINTFAFKLTKAQERVLEEIECDMENDKPMNRLLQGDVGSGKTAVSIVATYKAVKSGYQVAVMAPTAILAKQHLENYNKMLSKFGIRCELLVSGITKKQKEKILEELKTGKIDVIIGTHALLEENVQFKSLGLAITDEQHRFGVRQRETINTKGKNPDVLVMSATPIPRTLALILYGDLDISIIDELPPGRQKIDTFAVSKDMEDRVNTFIKKQIEEGRQCYIVCPLVEETEEIDAKSVLELTEKYKNEIFKEFRVEYIYGKLKPKEKEAIMDKFKNKEIDILISTTVIEVGVDVPNANIMVVENAERFGLATLHQLRGRVGRGEYKSYCILKYQGHSKLTKERMDVMTKTNDGFVISEKDLELRGSGEFFGTRQHGLPELKIANLFEDIELLKRVQSVAVQIMDEDPELSQDKNKVLAKQIEKKFAKRIEI